MRLYFFVLKTVLPDTILGEFQTCRYIYFSLGLMI